MNLSDIKKIFFIGIGGIGISATAGLLQAMGKEVVGSDAQAGEMVEKLRQSGIEINVPHSPENITADIELAVYSVAVPEDNSERLKAKELKIPELTYPQLLGEMMKDKYGIGVSGTDGKTTTTAMIGKILLDAGLDPTIIIGSKVDYLDGNYRLGQSKYFVFEADEYRRAFDNYSPKLAVITNIGLDHLDYYKDQEEYLDAFKSYLKKLTPDNFVVINNDDDNSIAAELKCLAQPITFSLQNKSDFQAKDIAVTGEPASPDTSRGGHQIFRLGEQQFKIKLPGHYNVANAVTAIAAARVLEIDWEIIKKSLEGFNGAWRRFERLGKLGQAEVIADYAHTPDAVAKVIQATKEFYPAKKILTVFQPHQYARTKNLFDGFAGAFREAHQVVIPNIFYVVGRENPEDFDVSSKKLTEAIKDRGVKAVYGGDSMESEKLVRGIGQDFDIILILGAGDVYELAKNLVK